MSNEKEREQISPAPAYIGLLLDCYCFGGTVTRIVADTVVEHISPHLYIIGLSFLHSAECP